MARAKPSDAAVKKARSRINREQANPDHKRLVKVTGYVWCDYHCAIHDDVTDVFSEGVRIHCNSQAWRSVFVKARPSEGSF